MRTWYASNGATALQHLKSCDNLVLRQSSGSFRQPADAAQKDVDILAEELRQGGLTIVYCIRED